MNMTMAPMIPIRVEDERLMTEVAVSVRKDILQQAFHAQAEDVVLARLGVVALYYADAAERLRQPAGHFGVNLGALAENGADGAKRLAQSESEDQQEAEGDCRSSPG